MRLREAAGASSRSYLLVTAWLTSRSCWIGPGAPTDQGVERIGEKPAWAAVEAAYILEVPGFFEVALDEAHVALIVYYRPAPAAGEDRPPRRGRSLVSFLSLPVSCAFWASSAFALARRSSGVKSSTCL